MTTYDDSIIEKWRNRLNLQSQSGLNKKDWCILNHVSRTSFFEWQRKLRDSDPTRSDGSQAQEQPFVELPMRTTTNPVMFPPLPPSGKISISAGIFTVNLSGIVDKAELEKVLRVVADVN